LAIIPYIILKIKSKQNQNRNLSDIKDKKLKFIYINSEKKIIKGKNKFLFLSGILYLIQQNLYIASMEVYKN
jgi:hypothetical protein